MSQVRYKSPEHNGRYPGYAYPRNPGYAYPRNPGYAYPRNPGYTYPRNPGYIYPRNPGYTYPRNPGYDTLVTPDMIPVVHAGVAHVSVLLPAAADQRAWSPLHASALGVHFQRLIATLAVGARPFPIRY